MLGDAHAERVSDDVAVERRQAASLESASVELDRHVSDIDGDLFRHQVLGGQRRRNHEVERKAPFFGGRKRDRLRDEDAFVRAALTELGVDAVDRDRRVKTQVRQFDVELHF